MIVTPERSSADRYSMCSGASIIEAGTGRSLISSTPAVLREPLVTASCKKQQPLRRALPQQVEVAPIFWIKRRTRTRNPPRTAIRFYDRPKFPETREIGSRNIGLPYSDAGAPTSTHRSTRRHSPEMEGDACALRIPRVDATWA